MVFFVACNELTVFRFLYEIDDCSYIAKSDKMCYYT